MIAEGSSLTLDYDAAYQLAHNALRPDYSTATLIHVNDMRDTRRCCSCSMKFSRGAEVLDSGGRLDCSSTPIRRFVVAMAVAVEHEGDKSAANHERKDDAQYHGDVPVDAYLNVN